MLLILKTIKIFKKYYQSNVVMWQRTAVRCHITAVLQCSALDTLVTPHEMCATTEM
jgi:hypothetical protein